MFSSKFPQRRHPERSASHIYRMTQFLWRGVEEPVLSVAEGTPAVLILPMLLGPFRPLKPANRRFSPAPIFHRDCVQILWWQGRKPRRGPNPASSLTTWNAFGAVRTRRRHSHEERCRARLIDLVQEQLLLEVIRRVSGRLKVIAAFTGKISQQSFFIFPRESGDHDGTGRSQSIRWQRKPPKISLSRPDAIIFWAN